LQAKFGITLRHDMIVELDSSTPHKFSRHLVFNLRRASFRDNFHVNAFVRHLLSVIESDRQRYNNFYVRKPLPNQPPPQQQQPVSQEEGVHGSDVPSSDRLARDGGAGASTSSPGKAQAADGGETLFIDLAVYTRNR
jgi:hypothetical protein